MLRHADPRRRAQPHFYSADTGSCEALVELAQRYATLFLCEASYPSTASDNPPDVHLTGIQIGRRACGAGRVPHRLVLTHPPGGVGDEARTHRRGRRAPSMIGEVEVRRGSLAVFETC